MSLPPPPGSTGSTPSGVRVVAPPSPPTYLPLLFSLVTSKCLAASDGPLSAPFSPGHALPRAAMEPEVALVRTEKGGDEGDLVDRTVTYLGRTCPGDDKELLSLG